MHIIIVGCGNVGATLTERLSKEKHDITIIDTNSAKVSRLSNRYDVRGVIGNGASYTTLIEAGIGDADLMIAVTDNDEQNLLCCLFAKKAGGCHTIARVRNPEYIREIPFIKEELGLSLIVNPEQAAAAEIARHFRFPSAIDMETFARGKVEILRFELPSGNCLNEVCLKDISRIVKTEVLICAVEREGKVIIPDGRFALRSGDLVSVVASPANAARFFGRIGIETNQVKDVILVGGGGISYYLAEQLADMGIAVTILEKDRERCEYLSEKLPSTRVINGEEIDHDLLMEIGLRDAEAFAALSGLDEENIMLSLFAARNSRACTVTKINHRNLDDLIQGMDLGKVIYPKNITSDLIAHYVRAMQNSLGSNGEIMYTVINDRVNALEFYIHDKSPVVGVPLQKLALKENLLLCCINRQGRIITPKGSDVLQVDDTVIVVTTQSGLKDVTDILREE